MHASLLHLWSFRAGATTHELVGLAVLPELITRMGQMSARFLPVTIPHLCRLIEHDAELGFGTAGLLGIDAAKALSAVLRAVDESRRWRWAGQITAEETGGNADSAAVIRRDAESALRDVLEALDNEVSFWAFMQASTRADWTD